MGDVEVRLQHHLSLEVGAICVECCGSYVQMESQSE